jgi:hypothetical protein
MSWSSKSRATNIIPYQGSQIMVSMTCWACECQLLFFGTYRFNCNKCKSKISLHLVTILRSTIVCPLTQC